jgi:hypothetical protein
VQADGSNDELPHQPIKKSAQLYDVHLASTMSTPTADGSNDELPHPPIRKSAQSREVQPASTMFTPTATPPFLKYNMKTHEVEGGNIDPFVQEDATAHGRHATKNILDHEEEHSTKIATAMLLDNASRSGPAARIPSLVTNKKTCYLCRKRGHFAKDCGSFVRFSPPLAQRVL